MVKKMSSKDVKKKNLLKKVIDSVKKLSLFEKIILAVYIIALIIIASRHEFSQDEAQSWLIARDLDLLGIIKQLKYEGHSILWYLILFPFAHLGFSIEIQKVIPVIFGIGTVYVILSKSPFPKYIKVLLPFSSGLIYYYGVFARPYCMIPLLLVLIASVYHEKEKHPYKYAVYLGLLANTHLIMVPTVIVLAALFWKKELISNRKKLNSQKKKDLIYSLLIFLLLLAMYLIIMVYGYLNCSIVGGIKTSTFNSDILAVVNDGWLDSNVRLLGYGSFMATVSFICHILIAIFLLLCIFGIRGNLKQALVFFTQYIAMLFIHSFYWFPIIHRSMIIIYTLMFWLWVYKYDCRESRKNKNPIFLKIALVMIILISAPATYLCINEDFTKNYSSGKETAKYIENNIEDDAIFVNIYQDFSQLVVGYLEKDSYRIYMANEKKFSTFMTWSRKFSVTDVEMVDDAIAYAKKKSKHVYIISPNIARGNKFFVDFIVNKYKLKLMYKSDVKNMVSEKYITDRVVFKIYKLGKKGKVNENK